jgi:microcystin-dependent protein
MSSTILYRSLGEQFCDANGRPLAGYKLYYYVSGTDTPQDTYDLRTGAAVSNPNPITLDAAGRIPSPVFLGDTNNYTELLTDTNGVTVSPWPFDNIPKAETTTSAAPGIQKLYLPWSIVTHGPHNPTVSDYGKAFAYNCTSGSITVNLPSAASIQEGTGFCVKKIDTSANTVALTPSGTETIDAVSGALTISNGDIAIWMTSDGANWETAAKSSLFGRLNLPSSSISSTPHTISAANAGQAYAYTCSSANIVVNLPAASSMKTGTGFFLRKVDATVYLVAVTPNGSDTIDGTYTSSVPFYLKNIGDGVWLISDGTSWGTIAVGASSLYTRNTAGQIAMFPGSSAPTGWLEANGALVSRTAYPALWRYAAGCANTVTDANWTSTTAYGAFSTGDGSTTFRLPDLRGYFLRSWAHDATGSLDYGRNAGIYQAQAVLSHTHTGTTGGQSADHTHNSWQSGSSAHADGNGGGGILSAAEGYSATSGTSNDHSHSFTSNATGGTQNIPSNIALITCISYT